MYFQIVEVFVAFLRKISEVSLNYEKLEIIPKGNKINRAGMMIVHVRMG